MKHALCMVLVFQILVMVLLAPALAGDAPAVDQLDRDKEIEKRERIGEWDGSCQPEGAKTATLKRTGRLLAGNFLLIPESTNDTVGLYDPHDGTYLGDLIADFADFATPLNAILGPEENVYVSDQVGDAVFVFDQGGNFLFTYADSADGINNIRGIAFRDDHLFVTSGDDYVAEFDGPHSRLNDFINDGSDPYDILFLSDGTCILADTGPAPGVKQYDAVGAFVDEIFPMDFPEQVQEDSVLPGAYLNAAFTGMVVTDFDVDGNIHQTTPLSSAGRGVFRLGNGNLLVTSVDGVHEVEPVTGLVIETENTGSARYIEQVKLNALYADQQEILETVGGAVNFTLKSGPANGGRNYILLASVSGTSPGTPLPGGMAVLPINWDILTTTMLSFLNSPMFQKFMGTLDANGNAGAVFDTLGPITGAGGLTLSFAFALNNPWDSASNAVQVVITQ